MPTSTRTNTTDTISNTTDTTDTTDQHADTRPIRPRRASPLLDQLDREWTRLRRRPATLRTVRGWTSHGALHDIAHAARDLDELVAATQPSTGDPRAADDALRTLVDLSATHELAGRIVLQRILGGLISAGGRWRPHSRRYDPIDIVIAAGWIAIRDFDTTARRSHIAPAIVADAVWIGFRRGSRRMSRQEVPVPDSQFVSRPAPPHELDPMPALAGTLRAAARAGVPSAELDFIRLLAAARTPSQAARDCQVAPRTIRNRRDAAGRSIREALGDDWSDWSDPLVSAA